MQPVASKHIQCSDRALTVWGISSLGNVSYCIPFVFFFHHFLPMCCPTHNILFSATNKKKIIIKKKKKKDFHFKHVIRVDLVFQHSAHMMQKLYKVHTLWLGDGCWLARALTAGWLVAVMTAGLLSVEGSGLRSMRLELCRSKNI